MSHFLCNAPIILIMLFYFRLFFFLLKKDCLQKDVIHSTLILKSFGISYNWLLVPRKMFIFAGRLTHFTCMLFVHHHVVNICQEVKVKDFYFLGVTLTLWYLNYHQKKSAWHHFIMIVRT